jgi:hypothetical protein
MARNGEYRFEAASIAGLIQQLSVSYIKNNYFYYVMGCLRPGKDPALLDNKIIEKYEINKSKDGRYWDKKQGKANLQYLRFEEIYLILATPGTHKFYAAEEDAIRDARRIPIKVFNHSVSYQAGHPSVRIEEQEFKRLKVYFREIAAKRTAEVLYQELNGLPYERYAPVRSQLSGLLREVNRARKAAGMRPVSDSCVRWKRKVCRPSPFKTESRTF